MATFYIKNETGEFVEADDRVEEEFRKKSDRIVSERLNKVREKETARIREEIEKDVREKATETIKTELRSEIEGEYKAKFDEYEAKNKELDVQLRRKSIAAEYGFKPEAEKYLGDGSDEEMRKEADNLKESFKSDGSFNAPEKKTSEASSRVKELTGLDIKL